MIRTDPPLLVEDRSSELIAEWLGSQVSHGDHLTVTEMGVSGNVLTVRVLDISDAVIRVEIVQGRLIDIDQHDDDWPFSGQPPGYFDEIIA